MTERLRVVLDTNVILSSFLSRNPSSPTKEIIRRWLDGEFILVVSDALVDEVTEKLRAANISDDRITNFLTLMVRLAEWIDVPETSIQEVIPEDRDDDLILACAVVGEADYLITYDAHFDPLGGAYAGVSIAKALPFLWHLRGSSEVSGG